MMRNGSTFALIGLAGLLAAGPALAQDAAPPETELAPPAVARPIAKPVVAKPVPPKRIPLPLPRPASIASAAGDGGLGISAPPSAPVKVATAAEPLPIQTVAASATAGMSSQAIVERANQTLNAMTSMSAQFVQVGQNGKRMEGNVYVQKPGRMRFEYKAAPIEIVADGSSVAIRDRKLNTQDVYSIGQTPLKFLLKERVDLARDTKLVSAEAEPDLVSVTVEDKTTFGGTSRVTMFFDPRSFALKQWLIVDPQGYETNVTLRNVQLQAKLDQNLFNINFTRILE